MLTLSCIAIKLEHDPTRDGCLMMTKHQRSVSNKDSDRTHEELPYAYLRCYALLRRDARCFKHK